jgi:hypothetical protein
VTKLRREQAEPRQLVCAECGAESEAGAVGWRGYLDDDEAAVIFCSACAAREFGADDRGGQAGRGGGGGQAQGC